GNEPNRQVARSPRRRVPYSPFATSRFRGFAIWRARRSRAMTDINAAMSAAASGMRAQTVRMRVAAENVANANSTGANPNEEPFRRRIPLLETTTLASGAQGVRVRGAAFDMSQFREE